MATTRDQIEHLTYKSWFYDPERPWKNLSWSRKWLEKQMNRLMRRKPIKDDDIGYKSSRKPTKGWEL